MQGRRIDRRKCFKMHIHKRGEVLVYKDEEGFTREYGTKRIVADKKLFPNTSRPFTTEEIKEIIYARSRGIKWKEIGLSLERRPANLISMYSHWKKAGLVDRYSQNTKKE